MKFEYFNEDDVKRDLETKGYFIHIHTSNKARAEVNKLCDILSDYFNKNNLDEYENKIVILNREIPPSCNFGVISRSDKFSFLVLKQDTYENELIKEIESYRI